MTQRIQNLNFSQRSAIAFVLTPAEIFERASSKQSTNCASLPKWPLRFNLSNNWYQSNYIVGQLKQRQVHLTQPDDLEITYRDPVRQRHATFYSTPASIS